MAFGKSFGPIDTVPTGRTTPELVASADVEFVHLGFAVVMKVVSSPVMPTGDVPAECIGLSLAADTIKSPPAEGMLTAEASEISCSRFFMPSCAPLLLLVADSVVLHAAVPLQAHRYHEALAEVALPPIHI